MTENIALDKKNNLIARLDRQLDWIKSCDTKASIVIAVLGVFLTIFTSENSINMLQKILSQPLKHINFANFLYLLLFVISWSIFIFGVYCLVRVLIPRLNKDVLAYEGIHNGSLYFFETIAKNNFLEFKEKVTNTNEEGELEDILSQIYVNAKICTIKYTYYSKGIKYASLGIASVLVLYVIGVILVMLGGFK
ncbi:MULTISPECIES: Pycsar system effector family protein [unclassified Bacillus cereus group]|uniref:Pycsar system effector family protein n=1 Tax=Bacillus cereus group TaxID=86661 RepID=UPI001F58C35B|nr:Pycsar system effector family protein [Bacillus cereus group sp. BfR-BA-01518]